MQIDKARSVSGALSWKKSKNYINAQFPLFTKDSLSTPDNSNLQGKSKKDSSYREFEENSRE